MNTAISPLDGRYKSKLNPLRKYFSEYALIYYRILIEIRWLQFLAERRDIPDLRVFTAEENTLLEKIITNFSEKSANAVKEIEKTTNHDVKAVEYFLKQQIEKTSLVDIVEWIHFSLTSEDVNNLSYSLMIKEATENVIIPKLEEIEEELSIRSNQWKCIPLLSRTHGQPASPTTLGKEFAIFTLRLRRQKKFLQQQEFLGKISGASGNFNAHIIAYPDVNWLEISEQFVTSLGLTWNPVVAQIEPHDFIGEISHTLSRINTLFIDFSRDIWGYVSFRFFKQKLKEGEVGSSAMPHKVNPIDFENAEGNFGISTSLFLHFAEKLPVSRWQRDLSDSTVLRNLGVAFGHHFLALESLKKGMEKLEIHEEEIALDLEKNPEILAEAVQTVMRKCGVEKPYEKLKFLTRGKTLNREEYEEFIQNLEIPEDEKQKLLGLTPGKYVGIAQKIVEKFI